MNLFEGRIEETMNSMATLLTLVQTMNSMLLYDMMFLGTKQWRQSSQSLPTIPTILMVDNEATVQIAKNGKLTRKTSHYP
jgi:hypothetical protein